MEKPYNVYDYEVLDRNGRRLGPVTGLWVDEVTGMPEFASVKTGWLLGKQHIIPVRDAHFDYGSRMLRVPYDERVIRDAPGFDPDHQLIPGEEARIYSHYRLARSPVGVSTHGRERTAEIPLHEERVNVGKQSVETGQVRLRKVVRTETREIPVELTRERVHIERLGPHELRGTFSGRAWKDAFQEDTITMTERREEPVIEKTRELVGGVRATKEIDTERRHVEANVRREDVEVDDDRTRERL